LPDGGQAVQLFQEFVVASGNLLVAWNDEGHERTDVNEGVGITSLDSFEASSLYVESAKEWEEVRESASSLRSVRPNVARFLPER
jgi:hypothetical protein